MKRKQAFSLFELSIVISILSVILTTGATSYFNYYKHSKQQNNTTKINNLKIAIESYFATNGYLPCPADPTLPLSSPNYGTERLDDTGTGCSGDSMHNSSSILNTGDNYNYNNANGAAGHPIAFQNQSRPYNTAAPGNYWLWGSVPTATLGLKPSDAIDGYGNKVSYVVHDGLANYKRHSDSFYQNLVGFSNFNLFLIQDWANGNPTHGRPYQVYNAGYVPSYANGLNFGSAYRDSTNLPRIFLNSSSCFINNFIGLFGDTSLNLSNNGINYVMDSGRVVINSCGMQIKNRINNAIITANNLAFVLISYGHTGRGAWNTSGTLNPASTNSTENANSYNYYVNNSGTTYSNNYYFNPTLYDGNSFSGLIPPDNMVPFKFYKGSFTSSFDNYIIWDTTTDLINNTHMSSAIYCTMNTFPAHLLDNAISPWYNDILTLGFSHAQQTISRTFAGVTKTCSKMGVWV